MTGQLDNLLTKLAAGHLDRPLINLEADVQRKIATRGATHHGAMTFASLRTAAVGLALIIGVSIGSVIGKSAVTVSQTSLFAAVENIAPSTLLEGAY